MKTPKNTKWRHLKMKTPTCNKKKPKSRNEDTEKPKMKTPKNKK